MFEESCENLNRMREVVNLLSISAPLISPGLIYKIIIEGSRVDWNWTQSNGLDW